MTECEQYGVGHGCDEDCPVFQRRECEMQEENEAEFSSKTPKAKPKKLSFKWSKKHRNFVATTDTYRSVDGALIHNFFTFSDLSGFSKGSLIEKLEERGYDIKTLKFEIEVKDEPT